MALFSLYSSFTFAVFVVRRGERWPGLRLHKGIFGMMRARPRRTATTYINKSSVLYTYRAVGMTGCRVVGSQSHSAYRCVRCGTTLWHHNILVLYIIKWKGAHPKTWPQVVEQIYHYNKKYLTCTHTHARRHPLLHPTLHHLPTPRSPSAPI